MADAYGAPEVGIYKRNILGKHAFKQNKKEERKRAFSQEKKKENTLSIKKKKKENDKEKSKKARSRPSYSPRKLSLILRY